MLWRKLANTLNKSEGESEAVQGKLAELQFVKLNVRKVYRSTVFSILEKCS